MQCEICSEKLNPVPQTVVKTGWMINSATTAHPCLNCGTLHNKDGKFLQNERKEMARLSDEGEITLFSLKEVDLIEM